MAWLDVVLYQPEIPPNTGNVGRTCRALGAKLWLVRPLGFDVDEHALRRAGMDYWQELDWEAVDDWDDVCSRLSGRRFWLFSKFASQNYADVVYQRDDVLVFGRESTGLPASIRTSMAESCVRIPMMDGTRSLNLSSAAAVACYEVLRQVGAAGVPGMR